MDSRDFRSKVWMEFSDVVIWCREHWIVIGGVIALIITVLFT